MATAAAIAPASGKSDVRVELFRLEFAPEGTGGVAELPYKLGP